MFSPRAEVLPPELATQLEGAFRLSTHRALAVLCRIVPDP